MANIGLVFRHSYGRCDCTRLISRSLRLNMLHQKIIGLKVALAP